MNVILDTIKREVVGPDSPRSAVARELEISPQERVADNLRRLRAERGWSQDVLAFFSGMHSTQISRMERAKRNPSLETVVRVAAALGVGVDDLLDPRGIILATRGEDVESVDLAEDES